MSEPNETTSVPNDMLKRLLTLNVSYTHGMTVQFPSRERLKADVEWAATQLGIELWQVNQPNESETQDAN